MTALSSLNPPGLLPAFLIGVVVASGIFSSSCFGRHRSQADFAGHDGIGLELEVIEGSNKFDIAL